MKYFGTDGIRRNFRDFDNAFLRNFALAIANIGYKSVVIGRDTRNSGVYMQSVISDCLLDVGVDVISLGVVPSPALSVAIRYLKCDVGIMLTASHNTPEFNGIKLFNYLGEKFSIKEEIAIETRLLAPYPLTKSKARKMIFDGKEIYWEHAKRTIGGHLEGLKVLIDCSYGAVSHFIKDVFSGYGAQISTICDEYMGENINVNCGSTCVENLIAHESGQFDVAFALDGDGDRVICYADGRIYDGDHIIYAHAREMQKNGLLARNAVVGTEMSNIGVENAYKTAKIKFLRAPVGDRNVCRYMKNRGINLGGENSGHVVFYDDLPTGDGIATALKTSLLHLNNNLINRVNVVDVPVFNAELPANFSQKEKLLNNKNMIFYDKKEIYAIIRPSGTEDKIRISVQCHDYKKGQELFNDIINQVKELINEDISH